jgi:hypothetical protein
MKKWFCLALSAFILSSCGGQRNASEVFNPGDNQYQKPTGDDSWSQIYDAVVLNDHQLKISFNFYSPDVAALPYDVFVDEAAKTVQVFGSGANDGSASLSCLQNVNGICADYEITSIFKFKYHVQHLTSLKLKTHSDNGDSETQLPVTLIEQADSFGVRRFAATTLPSVGVIYWLNDIVVFPNISISVQPISFGLPGVLKEPLSFYRFLYATEVVGETECVLYGRFEHILSGRQEVIEWHFLK